MYFCSLLQQLLDTDCESRIYKVQWLQVQEQILSLKEGNPRLNKNTHFPEENTIK